MRIALVLGSGGARGYAHIGVIEEIKRRGHEIAAISGTSMGSIIGGLEAAGRLDEFTDWATGLTQLDVLRLYDLALSQPGIIKADRIFGAIGEILDHVNIEDLPIPFTAVATDIVNHREVWFQRGSLEMAMRASSALPTFITPVVINGRILADGGLLNPVPVEPTTAVPSDLTVAVSLAGRPNRVRPVSVAIDSDDEDRETLAERLRRGMSGLIDVGLFKRGEERPNDVEPTGGDEPAPNGVEPTSTESADPGEATPLYEIGRLPQDLNTMSVVNMSLETMQALIERYRAAAHPANVTITIPASVSGTLDFHKAAEVIEVGRRLAAEAFDEAEI